jgi:two-component system, LytTR family, response regulator
MTRAIIIDDIPLAIDNLSKDIDQYCPTIELCGTANGVLDGAKLIKKVNPDLVFLDIRMNDGSGFDLLDIVGDANFKVIFVTAHHEHALHAFKYSALDYLLKPVDPDELKKAVLKIPVNKENNLNTNIMVLKEHLDNKKGNKRIVFNTQDKMHVANIADITRCESQGNYTEIYFVAAKKILVTNTLKDYEDILGIHGFYRVHQSHLINTNYIVEFIKSEDEILMKDNARVPVASRRKSDVIKMLEQL